jgi:hypothetical protein
MVPVVLPAPGTEIVPSGTADTVDDGVVAVTAGMDAEIGFSTIDGAGAGLAAVEGNGRGGTAGGCGAGTVVPGKTLMNDVSGCCDHVNGATKLADVGVEELGDSAEVVGAEETKVVVPIVDGEILVTVEVAGAICPDGVEQVTKVPGVAGLEVSGSGASVVSGVSVWVAAENGLGPLSGEDSMVPGVVESPSAVVPMVETWARLALHPNSKAVIENSRLLTAIPPFTTT